MTVEQKADKYASEDGLFLTHSSVRRAFIDGYHECQKEHEWHDLEKDPTDLPKHTNSVLGYCRGDYYDVCFFNGKRLIGHGESDFLKWKEIE